MADTDPLEYRQRRHPDLDVVSPRPDAVGPRPRVRHRRLRRQADRMTLRDILGVLRDSYCRTDRHRVHAHPGPRAAARGSRSGSRSATPSPTARSSCASWQAQRGRGVRDVPADQVRRPEAVLPRGRRVASSRCSTRCSTAAAATGLDEVCIGMPHRGRLNVLANIVGKSYGQIFREFEGNIDPRHRARLRRREVPPRRRGHVHRADGDDDPGVAGVQPAATSRRSTRCSRASSGPSRTCSTAATRASRCCPLLMHGDAAFAGQGVVAETLEPLPAARLPHRRHRPRRRQQPGRLHHRRPRRAGRRRYATDVARMVQAPIFHVNGDDPEACVRVARARVRVPAGVQQGRRHRHGLLPPPRPQRGRRPVADAAADVQARSTPSARCASSTPRR